MDWMFWMERLKDFKSIFFLLNMKSRDTQSLYRYFLPCWIVMLSSIFKNFFKIYLFKTTREFCCLLNVCLFGHRETGQKNFLASKGGKKLSSLSTLFNNYDCKKKYKGMKIPGQLHLERVTRFHSKFNWLILSFFFFFPPNLSIME